jgi:hypothetical protein
MEPRLMEVPSEETAGIRPATPKDIDALVG